MPNFKRSPINHINTWFENLDSFLGGMYWKNANTQFLESEIKKEL